MKLTAAIVIAVLFMAINIFPQKVIGYYNSGSQAMPYSAIPFKSLTHICHAFIRPNVDGTLSVRPGFINRELVDRAHSNNVKVLISLGGWDTVAAKNFKTFAVSPALTAKFVSELTNFIKANRYDGADIDWEYPDSRDADSFTALIIELRKSFKSQGIPLLAAALPSQDYRSGYNIEKLNNQLDWFSIMTYDFAGSWQEKAYNNSPLYPTARQTESVDNSVQYYIKKGMPRSRLLIGIAFYGYIMNAPDIYRKLTDKNVPSVAYTSADSIRKSPNWTYHWDNTAMVPYLQNRAKTQIVTYDDKESLRLKCQYVKANALGGAILWELHKDYNGRSSPLMEVVSKNLSKSKTPPPPPLRKAKP